MGVMQQPRAVTIYELNVAIGASERKSDWQQAVSLLAEVLGQEVEANVFSYCPAISACTKSANWQSSLMLLQWLRDEGLEASVAAFQKFIPLETQT